MGKNFPPNTFSTWLSSSFAPRFTSMNNLKLVALSEGSTHVAVTLKSSMVVSDQITALKVSKYGVFSGPYFPAFGLSLSVFSPNTGKYGPEKAPYLDTFHAVDVWQYLSIVLKIIQLLNRIYHYHFTITVQVCSIGIMWKHHTEKLLWQ